MSRSSLKTVYSNVSEPYSVVILHVLGQVQNKSKQPSFVHFGLGVDSGADWKIEKTVNLTNQGSISTEVHCGCPVPARFTADELRANK